MAVPPPPGLTVQYKIRNLSVFYSAIRARRPSVVLRAVRQLAVIDFQNGEQQRKVDRGQLRSEEIVYSGFMKIIGLINRAKRQV